MKVLVAAASHAYSFVIQAQALAAGLSQAGADTHLALVREASQLVNQVGSFKPDVVISVCNWINFPLMVQPLINSGTKIWPWIVCDEDQIFQYVSDYNQLGRVITVSQNCKTNLVRSGIAEKIITIIPEAVDSKDWYPENPEKMDSLLTSLSTENPSASEIKFDLKTAHDHSIPIIYTTGGDPTKKGAQEIMQALAKLGTTTPWIYLIKTWPSTDIFQRSIEEITLAEHLGIWPRVRYLVGEFSTEFMRGLANLCDIYAAPSRSEGFGLPLVEAALCAKPVLTCEGTAAPESVVHNQTGFIAKAGNVDELSMYLTSLLADKNLRTRMGEAGKLHALENYSPKVIGTKFLTLIHETN